MVQFLPLLKVLKVVPPKVWKAIGVFALLALVVIGIYRYGVTTERAKWEAREAALALEVKEKKVDSKEANVEVVVEYRDNVVTVIEKVEVVREKIKLIPSADVCPAPIEFIRVLDEAAAIDDA